MVIVVRLIPGMKLAQADSNVYGRTSDASCLRIAMVEVPNHAIP